MRRPFNLSLSLLLDRVITQLEATRSPTRRDALRRDKARLERTVPAYGPVRRPQR
jgi:hypothetical protein